jgi:predicted DNA-binding WGR domain protein
MRRFEFVGGTSAKFWEIDQAASEVTVCFGRLGTDGQTQTKDLASETAAADHVAKLIKEKLGKGYIEVTGTETAGGGIDFTKGITRPPVLPPYEVPAVPADGPAEIGGILLPAGRRLEGDPEMAPPGIEMIAAPVVWLTDTPVADAGAMLYRLRAPSTQIGLVPVLLEGMESEPTRPWDSKEFSPTDPRRTDHLDAAQSLEEMWSRSVDAEDDESLEPVRPFGLEFPGLAVPRVADAPSGFKSLFSRPADPEDDRAALARLTSRRIGLVAAKRPADTITALGWMGAANVHDDPTLISAVLRSWEDRWAARLVAIEFATLTLTVGNPPRDRETAVALAAEHYALCPDNILQGSGTLEAYAKDLIGSRTWMFWWD